MENRVNASLLSFLAAGLLVTGSNMALAQQRSGNNSDEEQPQNTNTIDAQTGKILNEAIELLNMDNYAGAGERIATLNLERLSPYERSKVEQILFNIAYSQDKYDEARQHLQRAIDAGGLNAQEVDQARYQAAQLYIQEEKFREGAAALEEWFKTAANPNSAAYYLLAAAYYQLEEFDRALEPAKKAVELSERPQEGWLSMLSALYLLKENYREAVPVLQQLINVAPDKKTYWLQLSSIYGQMEDYANALAVMQLAYSVGLVTEDSDIRRLADLLMFNEVPYRGAEVLEKAIADKTVTVDEKLYEKLGNSYIAAGELDKAAPPLERAAELASTGDLFVRLGELHSQREDWDAAVQALQRGIDKGDLRDLGNAQLWMGIAHYSQKNYSEARTFFERAQRSDRHRQVATSYLQAISAQS